MSDPNLTTKKRTRASCATSGRRSTGAFTRSKSQIYFHRTRSGQIRPDSSRPIHHHLVRKRKSESNPHDSFTTKDLQAHRVFPYSLDEQKQEKDFELTEVDNGAVKVCLADADVAQMTPPDVETFGQLNSNDKVTEFVLEPQSVNESQTTDSNAIGRSKSKVFSHSFRSKLFRTPTSFGYRRLLPYLEEITRDDPCRPMNQNNVDPGLSEFVMHDQSGNARSNGNDHSEVSNQIGDSIDGSDQMTPPEAVIYSKPGDRISNLKVEPSLQKLEHVMEKILVRSIDSADNKQSDSIPRINMVLGRCSRLKLFKTPGSFSYRRMLPFLKDIAKQDNSATGNEVHPKVNSLKEKPDLSLSGSDSQEIAAEHSSGSNPHAEHHSHETDAEPSFFAQCLSDNAKENVGKAIVPFDPQQQQELHVERNAKDTGAKCEFSPDANGEDTGVKCDIGHIGVELVSESSQPSAISSGFLVSDESLSKETDSLILHQLPVNSEGHTKSILKLEGPSKVETSIQLAVSAPGCKRRILKTNPRGCRGVCTCLNCSSFHLHAGRALEFSRNQMQDAEEVALDLIKTISYLRNVLENTTSGRDDATLEVKEACKRASEAEELAKSRLDQLNYDLDIHCRIPCEQRPTVRFANYVQEKIIPRVD